MDRPGEGQGHLNLNRTVTTPHPSPGTAQETHMLNRTLCIAALAGLSISAAHAQAPAAYPSKPIELVVHTAPGGGTDLVARMVGEIRTRS
jgi:hypothetical protein